ncbi:MAG TPA: cupredoxin domain-containing protein [Actinomycetota bacterium]|nr:cupredoxin domain-containing protein [Actinomycetota bacterium]
MRTRGGPPWTAASAVVLALATVACGGKDSGGPGTGGATCTPHGTTIQETAKNIAFASTCLAAPANQDFTIVFDNQDPAIPHDIHLFSDPAMRASIFAGALVTGPKSVTYQVKGLPPGTYHFDCDVHPTQMVGVLVVR